MSKCANRTELFARAWIFVGFSDDLARHNDFLTAEVGGISVVIQNFKGEIRALHNVCSHRLARLQTDARGNRALVCRFHGWSYDSDGVPTGIPENERFFQLDETACRELALRRFAVEACGRFVFRSHRRKRPFAARLSRRLWCPSEPSFRCLHRTLR